MNHDWKQVNLGEATEILSGFAFKSKQYTECTEDHRLLRGDNVVQGALRWENAKRWKFDASDERIQRYLLEDGDIVLAMDRPWIEAGLKYARVRADDLPALLVQRVSRLRAVDGYDQGYIAAIIGSPHFTSYIQNVTTGTAVPHISADQIRGYKFRVPSLSRQQAIAEILGALDDKVELNRKMNATLDELARTIFRSWFVDFDPVRAKMEGREPFGMDAGTAALFPDRLVDSPLGPLPEGWEIKKVNEVAEINKSSVKARDEWESIRYVDISSTREGEITELTQYAKGEEPSRARRRLDHGDTVLSTVRPDRRSFFLALNPPSDMIASTGFAVMSPLNIPWSFLHSALTQDSVFETLGNLADGGAYPAIRPNVIGELFLNTPSDETLLETYHGVASPLYELAASNRKETRTLADLRDTLLPELISGRIRVPEAERLVGEAV